MTGEEVGGPAGPKVLRLAWFVGAAVISTFAINQWRNYQRKSIRENETLPEKATIAVQNAAE